MAILQNVLSVCALIAISIPAAAFLLGIPSATTSPLKTAAVDRPATVEVRRLVLPQELTIAGELTPVETVEVSSRLSGHVNEIRFKPGDRVSAGALVASIRAQELEERLSRAETNLRAAESELRSTERESAEAERRLAESRELMRRDLIARAEAEKAAAAAETARAALALAQAYRAQQQAMLTQARAARASAQITAPFGGEVIRVEARAGDRIKEGGVLLILGRLERMKLVTQIRDGAALGVREGAVARVVSGQSAGRHGFVSRVIPNDRGTTEIQIVLENRQRTLRSGTRVEVTVDLEAPHDLVLLPRASIVTESSSRYVYTLESGRIVRREIAVRAEWDDGVAAARGLAAGEFVIADPKRLGQSR